MQCEALASRRLCPPKRGQIPRSDLVGTQDDKAARP